jgi:predicted RNase H-like HicB family nuclease
MNGYLVIYEQGEDGGWGAHCPDLPGVVAVGKSRARVEDLIKEAVGAYLDYMRDEGRPVPEPTSEPGFVAV